MPNQGFLRGSLSQYFLPKLMPHHQQGTLDGACGFYCVSMILDYFRLCSPEDEVADRRTRFSRLLQRLCKGDPFLEKGLSVSQINKALTFFNIAKGRFPRFDEHKEYHDPKTLLRFMKRHIRRGRPAMLLYTSPGTTIGHFVVVVGASSTPRRTTLQ
jgi:hypothetical protein